MNDEEYIFREDIRNKKSIGRSALHRVCGSKTKYVSLPSDKLTASEIKKRSGKVMEYNLSKPMSWHQYMSMPEDLQLQYLIILRDKYKGRLMDLSEMFGVKSNVISTYKTNHFGKKIEFSKGSKKNQAPEWAAFIGAESTIEDVEDKTPIDTPKCAEAKEKPTEKVKPASVKLRLSGGELRYSGNPAAIFQKAIMAMDLSAEYDITIKFDMAGVDI